LAKELNIDNRLEDGTYHLTPCTGSIAFMAPEVMLGKTYCESCDVYSMAILMYHMLALQFGFSDITPDTYCERVHIGGERPVLEDVGLSNGIKTILEKGWHVDHIKQRPTMQEFAKMVKDEITRVRGDEDSGFFDQSTRSSFSVVLGRNRRLLANAA
jgi:serine/threonine protein kinase